MATASDVLRIAAGEIGYSRWNDPQAGTKYGRWYAQKTGDSYYGQSGVPYCAMFVSWVFDQAKQSVPGLPGAYCPYIRRDGINAGLKVDKYKAQPGDIVLFDWNSDSICDHVGIVEANHGSYLQTIEGNGLPLDTPVLTPSGWVPIGSLQVGDAVVDPMKGEESKVKGVFPQGIRPCYEITFSDGRSIIADENHRWKIKNDNQKFVVMTTKEIANEIERQHVCEKIWTPIKYNKQEPLLVDPWAVGMAIGDGCLTQNRLCIANSDPQMINQLIDALGKPTNTYIKNNSKYGYVEGITTEWGDAVSEQFRRLGLMGKNWSEKTIPEEYMMASVKDRIALLRGLMDSDGTCDKNGRASYCTGNEELAMQVRDLIFSLGGHTSIYVKRPIYTSLATGEKKRGSLSYRVQNIRVPFNPFTKEFKASRYNQNPRWQYRGYSIKSIEPVKPQETVCISVTASSELYIAGDWIVTHNTSSGNSGSQSNGGCVARRTRSFGTINTILRPKYDTGVVSQDSTTSDTLDEDGSGGPKTIASWQTACGTYSDGIISGQVKANKDYLGNLWSVSYDRGSGSALVLHLQKMFGLDQDGLFGPNTARKTQQYLQNSGYSVGNSGLDGVFGHDSVVALQKSLNDGGKIWKASSANPAPEIPKSTVDSSKSTMVGIDVSSHDNFNGSTFKSNTESAYKQSDFVIVKATQGLSYVNPQCDGAYQRAKREGKCLGVYHYAGGNDANLEAAYFYNNVKGYIGEAIPCIDWESGSNKSWGNKNWVRTFVNKFHELSGVWCMIYVQASSVSQVSNCVNDCALWVAGYPDLRNSFNTPSFHYNISPWQAYTVWQFSSSNEQTDRNVANIGPDAWKRIAKGNN